MISLHHRSLLLSVFLCLLTTSVMAALGDMVHDGHRQNQSQDEPCQSQPQPDRQDEVRPPVVYIMESGWRPGIVPGFVIGPSSPRPAVQRSARSSFMTDTVPCAVEIAKRPPVFMAGDRFIGLSHYDDFGTVEFARTFGH
jgi:hypothetical protein